jgi:hypothetical protein
MNFFKWNACNYKQDILNQIHLIRPRTGNILVLYIICQAEVHISSSQNIIFCNNHQILQSRWIQFQGPCIVNTVNKVHITKSKTKTETEIPDSNLDQKPTKIIPKFTEVCCEKSFGKPLNFCFSVSASNKISYSTWISH